MQYVIVSLQISKLDGRDLSNYNYFFFRYFIQHVYDTRAISIFSDEGSTWEGVNTWIQQIQPCFVEKKKIGECEVKRNEELTWSQGIVQVRSLFWSNSNRSSINYTLNKDRMGQCYMSLLFYMLLHISKYLHPWGQILKHHLEKVKG